MFKPPRSQTETAAGPAGSLQLIVEAPEPADDAAASSAHADAYAVICHPHPLQGGAMTNKVVHTVARAYQELGVATIRFNFRGVGGSEGAWDEGRGEIDDALAVVEWGAQRWPGRKLWLGGFSFGGYIALRAAQRTSPSRLVTVSPAVSRFAPDERMEAKCPWLVIQGDADDVIPCDSVVGWASAQQPAPRIDVLAGAGHFFHGRLQDVRDAIIDFAR